VFVCYEGEEQRPRCHTWTILDVLEGQQQTALDDFRQEEADAADGESEADTCPHGYEWCDGPESDTLPCFDCFDQGREYDLGG